MSLLLAGPAAADITFFAGSIDSMQAVPLTPSPATGSFQGQYDSDANTFWFSWDISDNLIGTPSSPGAHIHLGGVGQTGPVLFGFNEPDGTWDLSGWAMWTDLEPSQVDALFNDGLYLNFHTTEYAAGEVRGQINLVPAPATACLIGLGGLVATRRRR